MAALRRLRRTLRRRANRRIARLLPLYERVTFPATVLFLFRAADVHPAHGLTWRKRFQLAYRMRRTTRGVVTGTSCRAHLAMAVKLLEVPPDVEGVIVECGCFQGGSTANLSLVCEIVGRELIAYDSFEGLPPPAPDDLYAKPEATGAFRGDLDTVRANVTHFGAIDRCTFRKGWFDETLPQHSEAVVMCFLDVDYQASLNDCVLNLWPHLTDRGYVFIDEYALTDYCALFWSERYWRTHFDTTPPGLLGAGTGVGVGHHYIGPYDERHLDALSSVAYTRKDFSGHWGYYPEGAA